MGLARLHIKLIISSILRLFNKGGVFIKNKLFKIGKYFVIFIIIIAIMALFFPTWTPKIKGNNSISVLKQVEVNGTNHEIMIRGKDINNPIIIFVHGGPGCPEIPYVTEYQDLL